MQKKSFAGLCLLSGVLGACSSYPNNSIMPTPTPMATITPLATPTISPTVTPTPAKVVSNTRTIQNRDGSSTVLTTYTDGSKSETRTFKRGRLARVSRDTDATGQRTARVIYREGDREVEVSDRNWVDKSMDATGDALAIAVEKTKQAGIEVGDKTEDAWDATKKGARATGEKAGEVGSAIKRGTKKGVNEVGDKAEDVGSAVKKGAKKVGSKIKDAVN